MPAVFNPFSLTPFGIGAGGEAETTLDQQVAAIAAAGDDALIIDPSRLSSLWQDASATMPVAADNTLVRRVNSVVTGSSDYGVSPSDASRALYRTSGGLHWLDFDGSDDFYSFGDRFDLHYGSLWAVVVGSNIGAGGAYYAKTRYAGVINRYALNRDASTLYGIYDPPPSSPPTYTTSSADTSTDVRLVEQRIDRIARSNRVLIGGTQASVQTFPDDTAIDVNSAYRFLVGAYNNATDAGQILYLQGRIYALFLRVGDPPTSGEIAIVQAWAQAKGGLS